MNWKNISIGAVMGFGAACSGGTEGAGSEPKTYDDMTFEERALFMNDVVLPHMKETFTTFDPKFANMSGGTCHGDGVSNGSYATPSGQVPRLPASEEEFLEYVKDPEHARWSQFMMDKVWPEMASLLKVKMFDPQTEVEGFSCHKVEGEH